ncbi:hypothetical protein NE237_015209 [Protea cynaroides]|uniref:Uncharacterized protein n=1 Tax=Protea cynaroides TaxID=273540 RepID=A0A9Q0KDE0_9MAGN|nr:hypothetical protein NE237_015209 [Protea cynaroides]
MTDAWAGWVDEAQRFDGDSNLVNVCSTVGSGLKGISVDPSSNPHPTATSDICGSSGFGILSTLQDDLNLLPRIVYISPTGQIHTGRSASIDNKSSGGGDAASPSNQPSMSSSSSEEPSENSTGSDGKLPKIA